MTRFVFAVFLTPKKGGKNEPILASILFKRVTYWDVHGTTTTIVFIDHEPSRTTQTYIVFFFCKKLHFVDGYKCSGQISSRPHEPTDWPPKGSFFFFWKGNPRLFQGNLGL